MVGPVPHCSYATDVAIVASLLIVCHNVNIIVYMKYLFETLPHLCNMCCSVISKYEHFTMVVIIGNLIQASILQIGIS